MERVDCERLDSDYRYPYDPPMATPPPKHIRGGWTAPPRPKLSHASLSSDLLNTFFECKDGVMTSGRPLYTATVVHENVHKLLPDVNKEYYDTDEVTL